MLTKFVEQPPEAGISLALDNMYADRTAIKRKTSEPGHIFLQNAERGHKVAVRRKFEQVRSDFGRHREAKRMKVLAVLDVGVYVFDDVFGKRRGEDAAMAKRTIAEFRASLAPGDNLVATQKLRHFSAELFFSGSVLVDDFGVVEDRPDFRRSASLTREE